MRYGKKKKDKFAGKNKIETAFLKLYSEEEMDILKTHDVNKLELIVAETDAHMMKAKKEMESNPEYVAAKETLDNFRGAFSDTKKYATAKKQMCIYLLQKHGIVDCGEEEDV